MTKDKAHLDRKTLLKLIKSGSVDQEPHLRDCQGCQEELGLLRRFAFTGAVALPDAPTSWIARAQAIAKKESAFSKAGRLVAAIVFDSWATPSPVGVRGMEATADRRLRFESEKFNLDLRAEQRLNEWTFIAQLRPRTEGKSVLKVDGKRIEPNDFGLFEWNASKAPREIKILVDDREIDIPELTWKRPTSTEL